MSTRKNTKSEFIHLRVDSKTKEEIIKRAEESNKTITDIILESVMTRKGSVMTNRTDTKILQKLLKPFAENGISIDLSESEINRIKELWSEIENA